MLNYHSIGKTTKNMAKLQPKGSEAVLYKKAPRREVDIVWNSQGFCGHRHCL